MNKHLADYLSWIAAGIVAATLFAGVYHFGTWSTPSWPTLRWVLGIGWLLGTTKFIMEL